MFVRRLAPSVLLALAFLTHLRAQNTNAATADLAGIVRGALGAEVVLHLRTLDDNPLHRYDGYEETTDKNGNFRFLRIKPGHYQFETGPAYLLDSPVSLTLKPGEHRRGLMLSGTPGYSLCGRVTENGERKNNTWVSTYRYDPEFGVLLKTMDTHLEFDGSFQTPYLIPGLYYLEGYSTFYPGSYSFSGATPLTVGPGGVTGCSLEIPLQYPGCGGTQISGTIASAPQDANAQYRVVLQATNAAGGQIYSQEAMNQAGNVFKPGDDFSITTCPGDYDIVLADAGNPGVEWSNGQIANKMIFDSRHLAVRDGLINGILLTPIATASITGEVPGMSHGVICPGGGQMASVSILREGDGQYQSVQLDDKNRFSFRHVAPGDYQVSVGPVDRETVYLDSILINGKPIQGRKLTVTQAQPITMTINLGRDQARAPGHLSPDRQQKDRWEVSWTRPKGTIAGKVLDGNSAGISVQLRAARYNSNASAIYTAQLTADGAFQFQNIDPGVYLLRAEGKSIVPFEYGAPSPGLRGTPVVVKPGADIKGLNLSPAPFSFICGRVTDQQGAPLARTRIFPNDWVPGGPSPPIDLVTDADGRFRISGAAPGTYFFAFHPEVHRAVYFSPDGTLRTATPVSVEAGKNLGCGNGADLELRVPTNYRATYSFSGKVIGKIPAIDGDRFWVILSDEHASGRRVEGVARADLDSENRFSFANVPPGQFLLELHSAYGPEPRRISMGSIPVTHLLVSQTLQVDSALKEVVVTPMVLPRVTGTVRFSHIPEAWVKYINRGRAISLSALGSRRVRFGTSPFTGNLADDGSFSINPVDTGDYQVTLTRPEGRLFIKSLRMDGQEVQGSDIHLTAGAVASLEVEVSGASANVQAHRVPDETLPLAEPPSYVGCSREVWPTGYQVVLFSEEPNGGPATESLYSGPMQIQGVPPGKYRALAFDSLQVTGPGRTAIIDDKLRQNLRAEIMALGVPVVLQPGQTLNLSLPDKTIQMERIASRLGCPLDSDLLPR